MRTGYISTRPINDHEIELEDYREIFSRRLDKLMRSKGISNRKLADALYTSPTVINNYRTGKTLPDIYRAFMITRAIGCTVDALLEL